MTTLAVIDHGAGNLVSITRGLEHVGAQVETVDHTTDLERFDGVVLPGVGATGAVMRNMQRRGLIDPVRSYSGRLLGVCVGMQVLFDHSDENDNPCLGLIPGRVRRLRSDTLPHMGWNDVEASDPMLPSEATPFYFVHSYVVDGVSDESVSGWTSVDSDRFPSVVRSGLISGVQFHPERSGPAGLAVLAAFVEDTRNETRAA